MMAFLEELLEEKVIYDILRPVMTIPNLFSQYIMPEVTLEIFLLGFWGGYWRNNEMPEGFNDMTLGYETMVASSLFVIYSIGYNLGEQSLAREMLNPYREDDKLANTCTVFEHIGKYITRTEEGKMAYHRVFEEVTHTPIVSGRG